MCYQLSSRKVDAQSVTNWTVDNTSELRRSTAVVYHSDRQALSTARFRRAGQLATADTCTIVLWTLIFLSRSNPGT